VVPVPFNSDLPKAPPYYASYSIGIDLKKDATTSRLVNNIEVLPLSSMDNQIRAVVYRAIYGDPALSDRYGFRAVPSIHILVKNGNVVLEGVVARSARRSSEA